MAWWDARSHRASPPSRRKQEFGLMDGLLSQEQERPRDTRNIPAGVLSPITEEEVAPFAVPPLVVQVCVRFTDPIIRSRYDRSYGSSQNFMPTDRICKGLLRRIEHCCEELITRKDSEALHICHEETGGMKRQRYEITFRIFRREGGLWAERTFKSYQKQPLTINFTKQVILATHRMVGLFLRSHDKEFRWLYGSVREDYQEAITTTPSLNDPISPCCVPRSRFVEASQSFEFIPGYTISLSFRSRSPRPSRTEFSKILKITSDQNAPLNLLLAEELFWDVSEFIHSALATKKRQFDEKHQTCEGLEGLTACTHLDDDAVHIDLRITNNLGPSYDHLHREFRSKLTLFHEPGLRDSLEFIEDLERRLEQARDRIDDRINLMNDFELRLVELRSPTWSVREPVTVSLGPSASYSRRTIEAVLDRVQTGVGDVLRGNHVAVHMAAYKRGHLVLDKALVARQAHDEAKKPGASSEGLKEDLMARLESRIRQDIDKVCRDTCSLEGIPVDEEHAGSADADAGSERRTLEETHSAEGETPSATQDRAEPVTNEPPVDEEVRRVFSLGSRSISRQPSSNDGKMDTEKRQSLTRTASEAGSMRPSMEAAPSPRIFPLVPARHSTASRSSTGSTLGSQLAELLLNAIATDMPSEDKGSTDGPVIDRIPGTAEHASSDEQHSDSHVEESESAALTSQQQGTSAGDLELGSEPQLGETAAEAPVINAKALRFELGPPIALVEETQTQGNAGDWDSSSSDTGDEDDSGAKIDQQPLTYSPSPLDDFARSRIDVMETSQYLPTEGNDEDELINKEEDDLPTLPNGDDVERPGTAPSTPGLSSGCDSSPRNSILITPTILRTQALVALSDIDYVKAGSSHEPGATPVEDDKHAPLDIHAVGGEDHGEPSSVSVHAVHLDGTDEPSSHPEDTGIVRDEDLPPSVEEDVACDQDQPTKEPNGAEINHQEQLALDEQLGTKEDANTSIEQAPVLDAPVIVELPSSAPMASMDEMVETGDIVAGDTEGDIFETGGTDPHDEHASESDKVIPCEAEAGGCGSSISEDDGLDPATVQLPLSPELDPFEPGYEPEFDVREDGLEARAMEEDVSSLQDGAAHIVLDSVDKVALPELAGCGTELEVPSPAQGPPTAVREVEDVPVMFDLDSHELQELDGGETPSRMSTAQQDKIELVEEPGRSGLGNEATETKTAPVLPIFSAPDSDTLVASGPVPSEVTELAESPAGDDSRQTVVLGHPTNEAEAVDNQTDQAEPQVYSHTAPSTSSYLTARERPNPFEQLLSELDSASVNKELDAEHLSSLPSDHDTTLASPPHHLNLNLPHLPPSSPPSPVSSTYTFASASSHSEQLGTSPARDSVDTVAPPSEADMAPEKEYRPSTAGWLGFREANLQRRFSLPLQYLFDPTGSETGSSRPGTPVSTGTVKHVRRDNKKPVISDRPRPMSSGALLEMGPGDGPEDEKKGVLPRVIMLFAGMAFASGVLNGDGA